MLRSPITLAALLVAMAPCIAPALDRGHFKGLEEQDLDPILAAFEGVEVHYLLTEGGDTIMSRMAKPHPKVSFVTDAGVFMYFNPRDAQWARDDYLRTDAKKAVVRTSRAAKIVREQFRRRNAGPSQGAREPDFVIFLSLERRADVIEYLAVRGDAAPMTVQGAGGRKTVVAFLSRAKAMQVQAGLKQGGVEADRIGLDQKQFMGFIADQAKQGRAVQIQGY